MRHIATVAATPVTLREVLFEFHFVGASTRVVAIDPVSGIEVVMVGAAGCSKNDLMRLAARKLAYVFGKKNRHREE